MLRKEKTLPCTGERVAFLLALLVSLVVPGISKHWPPEL